MLWLLMLLGTALAQDPAWMAEDATPVRFADSDTVKAAPVKKGEQVVVLFEEKGRVRIRKGTVYGWVPSTAITKERPELDLGGLQLDFGDLKLQQP